MPDKNTFQIRFYIPNFNRILTSIGDTQTRNYHCRLFRIALVFLFTILGIASKAQKIYKYQDKHFIYKILIDSALSADSANFEYSVGLIRISRSADRKLIQIIYPPKNFVGGLPQSQLFIIEDVNFDGLNDFRIVRFIPADPNIPYYYWTFNKTTGKFQRYKALEEITSPDFDHRRKLIGSFWRSGCCDHGLNTYKYIHNKPVLINELEIKMAEGDTSKYILTVKKRMNDKMRLVKRTVENASEDN